MNCLAGNARTWSNTLWMRTPGDGSLIDSSKPTAAILNLFCMLVVDVSGHAVRKLYACPALTASKLPGSCRSTAGASQQ
eukprot:4241121-Lingulodinium_polyedra.AAC.1